LYSKGLGFGYTPPPDIVAAELSAQVDSIRTGLTPRRKNPKPPEEVRRAVELAKTRGYPMGSLSSGSGSGGERNTGYGNFSPIVAPDGQHGNNITAAAAFSPALVPYSSAQMSIHRHDMYAAATPPPSTQSHNGYSIGKAVPPGVNWRYVDVLNNPNIMK
jgi:hypothetical protein